MGFRALCLSRGSRTTPTRYRNALLISFGRGDGHGITAILQPLQMASNTTRDTFAYQGLGAPGSNNARHVGRKSAEAFACPTLNNDRVFHHQPRFLGTPAALSSSCSVPFFIVPPGGPTTVTFIPVSGCMKCRWLPRCSLKTYPYSINARSTSRFLGGTLCLHARKPAQKDLPPEKCLPQW